MINWTRSETSTMADSTVIWIHKPLEINYKNINSAYVKSDSFPYFELSILAMINFTSSLSVSSLFTYVPFMVVEMGLVDNLDKAGFYAGPIAASLFFGRFFSSYLWGYMADIYGRKPILTMALLSILIFSIFFGLSKNLITAVTSRFLLGFFNPSIGIIKTLISELCSKKHEIRGIAVTSGSWSLGLIFGPALGSYLSNPVLKYPNIFTKDSIFNTYNYLLPNLIIAIIAIFILILFIFYFPETLPRDIILNDDNDNDNDLEITQQNNKIDNFNQKNNQNTHIKIKKGLKIQDILYIPGVCNLLSCSFIAALMSTILDEVYPLWALCSVAHGGLDLTSVQVANILSISGFVLVLYMFLISPVINEFLGNKRSFLLGSSMASIGIYILPFAPLLAQHIKISTMLIILYIFIKMSFNLLFSASSLLLNHTVLSEQRGSLNGINMIVGSFAKSIGPLIGSTVFAWTASKSFPFPFNHHLIFIITTLFGIGVSILAYKAFKNDMNVVLVTDISNDEHENSPLIKITTGK